MNFCEKNHKEHGLQMGDSLEKWLNRNQRYFILYESLREELDESIKNDKNSKTTIEEYETEINAQFLQRTLVSFENKHNAMTAKEQVASCQDVAMRIMNGDLDIARNPQVKAFLEQRLLDDAAPNLSAEIEVPVPSSETAESIEAKVQVDLKSIGKYSISSKQSQNESTKFRLIRITFERHFPRKEAKSIADQLFKTLYENLPANLGLRVYLKFGMDNQLQVRHLTPN